MMFLILVGFVIVDEATRSTTRHWEILVIKNIVKEDSDDMKQNSSCLSGTPLIFCVIMMNKYILGIMLWSKAASREWTIVCILEIQTLMTNCQNIEFLHMT